MDMEEKKKKLEFLQKFFVKSFLISFILVIVSSILCIAMGDFQLAIVQKYFHADAKDLGMALILVFGIWKVLIIQFTLVPALAIFCIRKCCKCKCACEHE